ncbi:MAG: ABC transporter ATP-binding protein [Chloroflexota bacterium]
MPSEKLIVAKNISKSFGSTLAVDNVSLEVRSGEIYGLVGPDGAGKTTTMRLLCGALRPDAGEIIVGGVSMVEHPDRARDQIGYLSQRFSLYEELTVLENLRFFAEVRGLSPKDWLPRAMEILAFVGLGEFTQRRAGYLSGGMKQKLGLATALVHRPQILLLDEPTGGVDPVTRQDFWQLIIRLVTGEGVSVLVSTPYMDEAVRCTYVGFMQRGRLIVEDNPQALRQRLEGRVIELRGYPMPALRQLARMDEDIEGVQAFGDRLHLRVREGTARKVISRLKKASHQAEARITEITMTHPQLEDVFIALLEAKQ